MVIGMHLGIPQSVLRSADGEIESLDRIPQLGLHPFPFADVPRDTARETPTLMFQATDRHLDWKHPAAFRPVH